MSREPKSPPRWFAEARREAEHYAGSMIRLVNPPRAISVLRSVRAGSPEELVPAWVLLDLGDGSLVVETEIEDPEFALAVVAPDAEGVYRVRSTECCLAYLLDQL